MRKRSHVAMVAPLAHTVLFSQVELLSLCRHENLLPLLGYSLEVYACRRPSVHCGLLSFVCRCEAHGTRVARVARVARIARIARIARTLLRWQEGTRCLVYPLMSGGNLEEAILRLAGTVGGRGEPLKWRKRLKILRGASRALLYLHTPTGDKGVILHRDIKPANILLDAELNAKLSDVGLATHKPMDEAGEPQQARHVSTHLRGTIGYLDPVYMQTGIYTTHADAYAMGVSMLVCLTGREAKEAMRTCQVRHAPLLPGWMPTWGTHGRAGAKCRASVDVPDPRGWRLLALAGACLPTPAP